MCILKLLGGKVCATTLAVGRFRHGHIFDSARERNLRSFFFVIRMRNVAGVNGEHHGRAPIPGNEQTPACKCRVAFSLAILRVGFWVTNEFKVDRNTFSPLGWRGTSECEPRTTFHLW